MLGTVLIFGGGGMDAHYLTKLCLEDGYNVIGVLRRSSLPNDSRIREFYRNQNFKTVLGDVTDAGSVFRIIDDVRPQLIFNLAAQSHVYVSFNEPSHTWDVVAGGCLNILEAIRHIKSTGVCPRFYQASSSEQFGDSYSINTDHGVRHYRLSITPFDGDRCSAFQNEQTPMHPCSPYAVAKLAAHNLVDVYRRSYGAFACSGILYNHESPHRSETFVTRKITKYVAKLVYAKSHKRDLAAPLHLGNLDAYRDWGHACDHCRAMLMMLQQNTPQDYVIATGETHTVREFLEEAFKVAGISDWESHVAIDPALFRPCEVAFLKGDASKAKKELGWTPSMTFKELVKDMVFSDIQRMWESND